MKKYVLGFVMLAGGLVVTSLNNGIDNTKIIETEIFTV